ncbi:histidinol dehydrogenase [Fodinicurvata sediminis]|uniref:histidinol dehydrogenase n=1 Tax=Fodinicurvata sediminis TaxID=1121832 RepID=UPI0003B333F1|nr:histidinol dehydrogenase [Fodinicurvata sediminis]
MPYELDTSRTSFESDFNSFLQARRDSEEAVDETVKDIIARVRREGDTALIQLTEQLDRVTLTASSLRFGTAEIDEAESLCETETLEALAVATERITDYHRRQRPEDLCYEDALGVRLGHRWTAMEAAGIYVPGGTASYPSSVLMNAIPAKVAGVERVAMAVPTPEGRINPLVLVAARMAGVDEIYRMGGAQAVAALAYGTETVAPVDKITGPGNAYVASAKRQVFGQVGIDMIAGPSEILVIADGQNDPAWIAADLLSQAEHDTSAQSILISDDSTFLEAVQQQIDVHLQRLPRSEIASQSWRQHGALIKVEDLEEAPGLVDRVAPEHLELAVADPDGMAKKIRHAGAIFLGRHTPEALGDYLAGPNHVLPTGRSARFSSGLSVLDFMKRSSLIQATEESLRSIAPPAMALAHAEGLDAHALSLAIRLGRDEQGN